MKCLDSALLIDFTRGDDAARGAVERAIAAGAVTTELNVFELCSGAHDRGRPITREMEAIGIALRGIDVLPLTRPASYKAAEIASLLRLRGREIGTLDLLISAISLVHGVDTVVTRDAEDFGRVPGLHVETY